MACMFVKQAAHLWQQHLSPRSHDCLGLRMATAKCPHVLGPSLAAPHALRPSTLPSALKLHVLGLV